MSHEHSVIHVEHVSKKFCRDLKRSLWYGLRDIAADLNPFAGAVDESAGVSLRKGEFWASDDISFSLKPGECLGLIGHNGAGKTTLLKMLNGLIKPDRGSITIRGRMGALIALGAGFNPILSGRENIYVNGAVLGLSKPKIDAQLDRIVDFAEIGDFIDAPVQSYSSGMVVRLGFAIASNFRPDVMLLDEVLAVGDMAFQAKCFNRLGELRNEGTAFILVSHNMLQITRFCQSVLYLNHGRVAYVGETDRGVQLFHEEMNAATKRSRTTQTSQNDQAGSLRARMVDAYFVNGRGERVSEISSKENVSLVIDYECPHGAIENPVLEIGMRDSGGDMLHHGNNRFSEMDFGRLHERGQLMISFASLPANNQSISTSLALWDSSLTELLHWRSDLKLTVKGHPRATGRILLDSTWRHTELDTADHRTATDGLVSTPSAQRSAGPR